MPFSTSRAAVSRCLLALAVLLSLSLLCAVVVTPADAARKRSAVAKKQQLREKLTVQKQRGKAGRWAAPKGGRSALRGTTMGINAGGGLFQGGDNQTAANLAAVARTGARVVRFDASWGAIEPLPGIAGASPARRFGDLDRRVIAARRAGLRPLLMLGYGAPWATPGGQMFATPHDPQAYARFAAAVATRYAPGSDFWSAAGTAAPAGGVLYEIWNEPNAEHFLRDQQTAPGRYATLLLHAQRAIRQVDPAARISTGGLVPIGAARFLAEVLRAEPALRGEIQAVGWHPYERSADAVVEITRRLRKSLDGLGLSRVPLDITEFGWATTELAEPVRSLQLGAALQQLSDPALGVGLLMPYVAMDHGGPDSYGLWRVSGEETASVRAFAAVALRKAAGR